MATGRLAFAAYHRGPGSISKRLRKHPWRPQDGLDRLPLPGITKAYVRHALGLAALTRLGVLEFPAAHKTQPLIVQGPVDLQRLAKASGIDKGDIFRFNPELDYSQYVKGAITLHVPEGLYLAAQQNLPGATPQTGADQGEDRETISGTWPANTAQAYRLCNVPIQALKPTFPLGKN